MDLKELQQHWQRFGEADPLWAILTADGKDGGRWNEAEFFATGRAEVAAELTELQALGLDPERGRALDFGCGVGRLTQALADHFSEVVGIDIAPAMIDRARSGNRHGGSCTYHLNERADLSVFPNGHFDFIYSSITLQHMEPRYALQYIREFARVLTPGGVLSFQLPEQPVRFRVWLVSALPSWLRRLAFRWIRGTAPVMEMHGVGRTRVERVLAAADAPVKNVRRDDSGGPDWPGFRYTAVRAASAHEARSR